MEEKIKRTWHYLQKPAQHSISCTKCNGSNLDWSEWHGHVWCHDCEIDFKDYHSVLSGPVPMHLVTLLGVSVDSYDMVSEKISHYSLEKREFVEMTLEEYKKLSDESNCCK
jgi:hypothetical protein